jgi:hypothetical protein
MGITLKERCNRRLGALKAARLPYEAEWKEIAKYVQPSRSRFLNAEQNRNFKRSNDDVYNSHAILSFRTLTGGMTSGLSSPSRPWFRLVPFDQDLAGDASVRVWLAEVERRLYAFLASTNFYGAMKSGYAEMGMFGTEACVMVEHWQAGAVCHAMTAGEYWLALSDASVPDTLSYAFDMPATILRNLDHLEGRTIKALADGNVVSGLVVTNGVVELPSPASIVTAGLPYDATIETLPLAYQGQAGWTIAKPQTQAKAVIRVIDTRALKVGPTDARLETLRARTTEILGQPNALQNGLVETWLRPDINGGARVVLQSSDPLPMTVTGIYLDPDAAE